MGNYNLPQWYETVGVFTNYTYPYTGNLLIIDHVEATAIVNVTAWR